MADIYLVTGATGGVGQQLVSKLLLRGAHVRTLVRDRDKGRALLGENLELFVGDSRRPDTLHSALQGVSVVLCATGTRVWEGENSPRNVDYDGVRNLVLAAQVANVGHFVLVSSIGVTHPDHPLNQYGQVLMWKGRGEDTLRESGLTYTIVRPGGLTDEPGGQHALQFGQGDTISGRISRATVAEVCLQALQHDSARQSTFEVIEIEGTSPASTADWDGLFGALKTDKEIANA